MPTPIATLSDHINAARAAGYSVDTDIATVPDSYRCRCGGNPAAIYSKTTDRVVLWGTCGDCGELYCIDSWAVVPAEHAPCASEYCHECFPTLAHINADLADVSARMGRMNDDDADWMLLCERYDTLHDARWRLLMVSGLYGERAA